MLKTLYLLYGAPKMVEKNVKIITDVIERSAGFHVCYGIGAFPEGILQIRVTDAENLISKLQKNAFVTVKNVNIFEVDNIKIIKLGNKSRIFTVAKFEVDDNLEREFLHAPRISLPEALASQVRRRVSIEGKIVHVGRVINSPDNLWRRKDIVLIDDLDVKLKVKLWGEFAEQVEPVDEEKVALIENVEIEVFRGAKSCNSTGQTSIIFKNLNVIVRKEFMISGMDCERLRGPSVDVEVDEFTLLTSTGQVFKGSKEVVEYGMKRTYEDMLAILPFWVVISATGNNITAISPVYGSGQEASGNHASGSACSTVSSSCGASPDIFQDCSKSNSMADLDDFNYVNLLPDLDSDKENFPVQENIMKKLPSSGNSFETENPVKDGKGKNVSKNVSKNVQAKNKKK